PALPRRAPRPSRPPSTETSLWPCQLSSHLASPGQRRRGSRGQSRRSAADATADRRWQQLSDVLLLSGAQDSAADILPSLGLLPHTVRLAPAARASVAR